MLFRSNDDPYFGSNGVVCLAWDTQADNGSNIEGFGLQSFQYFGAAREKQCTMIRPHVLTNGSPNVYGNVNADFDLSDTTSPLSFTPTTYGVWDTGTWDTAIWGSDLVALADWQGSTGVGYCFAPVIKIASNSIKVQWVSSDLVFESGGVI